MAARCGVIFVLFSFLQLPADLAQGEEENRGAQILKQRSKTETD
jgi:hypothetical protein